MSRPSRPVLLALLPATALAALLGAVALPALAQGGGPGARLTPEQQQQLFPEQKALLLQGQQQRVATHQTAERCIRAAQTPDALRACMQQQRQAHQLHRQQQREGMAALARRHGIERPEQRPDGAKPRGTRGAGSGRDA